MTTGLTRRGALGGAAGALMAATLGRRASVRSVVAAFTGGPVTLWRLDTTALGAPCRCRACLSHADNKIFATRDAALRGRAHVGCRCEPVPISLDDAESAVYFSASRDGGQSVDLRHVRTTGRDRTTALDPEL